MRWTVGPFPSRRGVCACPLRGDGRAEAWGGGCKWTEAVARDRQSSRSLPRTKLPSSLRPAGSAEPAAPPQRSAGSTAPPTGSDRPATPQDDVRPLAVEEGVTASSRSAAAGRRSGTPHLSSREWADRGSAAPRCREPNARAGDAVRSASSGECISERLAAGGGARGTSGVEPCAHLLLHPSPPLSRTEPSAAARLPARSAAAAASPSRRSTSTSARRRGPICPRSRRCRSPC